MVTRCFSPPDKVARVAIEQPRVEAHLDRGGDQARIREVARRARGSDSQVVAHRAFEEHRRLHDQRRELAQLARIERADVAPVEAHATAGWLGQTVETPQQRGFARARGAEQDERAAALHPDRHVLQDGRRRPAVDSIIGEREMLDLKERIRWLKRGGHALASVASAVRTDKNSDHPTRRRKCPHTHTRPRHQGSRSAVAFLRKKRAESPGTRCHPKEWEERKRGITMDKVKRPRKLAFMALAALAIVLAVTAPSQARAMGGHSFGDGHSGGSGMQHGFDGHHDFDRGGHRRFGFGPIFPYYGYYPPVYGYQAPAYWYYCPSYGAYYPSVASCPEAWVPVPAS